MFLSPRKYLKSKFPLIQVEGKLKEVKEEFNQSHVYLELNLKDEITTVCEHAAIHNEQYSRKNSVRVSGITEEDRENVEEKVIAFFKSNLRVDVSRSDVEIAHRIGQRLRHDVTTAPQRPRQVILKFTK